MARPGRAGRVRREDPQRRVRAGQRRVQHEAHRLPGIDRNAPGRLARRTRALHHGFVLGGDHEARGGLQAQAEGAGERRGDEVRVVVGRKRATSSRASMPGRCDGRRAFTPNPRPAGQRPSGWFGLLHQAATTFGVRQRGRELHPTTQASVHSRQGRAATAVLRAAARPRSCGPAVARSGTGCLPGQEDSRIVAIRDRLCPLFAARPRLPHQATSSLPRSIRERHAPLGRSLAAGRLRDERRGRRAAPRAGRRERLLSRSSRWPGCWARVTTSSRSPAPERHAS